MGTTSGRRLRSRPFVLVLAVASSALACGCQSAGSPASSSSPAPSARAGLGALEVRYTASRVADGSRSRIGWDIVTDGKDRIRSTIVDGVNVDGPAVGTTVVWDGTTLLSYEPDGNPKYRRTRHPTQDEKPPPPIVLDPRSAGFARSCPRARHVGGTRTYLGRPAARYRCGSSGGPSGGRTWELVLDEATGLLLTGDGLVVTALTFDPRITRSTFSTEMPGRAVAENFQRPPAFRLPRVGGGELALADYRRAPLIIVTGDAAGIRAMAARLDRLEGGPDGPSVIGLLFAMPPADWQGSLLEPTDVASLVGSVSAEVGRFDIPVAIDFKGSAGGAISGPAGVPVGRGRPAAVGFLRSDGALTEVLTETATDDRLRAAIRRIS